MVPVKTPVGADVKMPGVEVDCALGGVRDAQSGGGMKKYGGEVSPLEAVGHRYAMDSTMKVSFVSDQQ